MNLTQENLPPSSISVFLTCFAAEKVQNDNNLFKFIKLAVTEFVGGVNTGKKFLIFRNDSCELSGLLGSERVVYLIFIFMKRLINDTNIVSFFFFFRNGSCGLFRLSGKWRRDFFDIYF